MGAQGAAERHRVEALSSVTIHALDLDLSRQFYGEWLDLELLEEAEGKHLRFRAGAVELRVEREEMPAPRRAGGVREEPALSFAVRGLEAAFLALLRKGVKVKHRPTGGPDGRFASVYDPDGHEVVLRERK